MRIIGIGTVGKFHNITIGLVLLLDGLKNNILRIIQLCNKGNSITFYSSGCMFIKFKLDPTIFTRSGSENTYIVNLNKITSNDVLKISNMKTNMFEDAFDLVLT